MLCLKLVDLLLQLRNARSIGAALVVRMRRQLLQLHLQCILLVCHLVELIVKVVAFLIDLFQVFLLGTQRGLQRFDLQVGDDSASTSHLPHRATFSR